MPTSAFAHHQPASAFEQARFNMVEQQIRPWDVLDASVLELLYLVRREEFVPPAMRALAFSDLELPIGEGQCMLQPKLEARIVQELAPGKTERVLEIGTGSGYLTALLAHRAQHVLSVELRPTLKAMAEENLSRHGCDNVTLAIGDGSRGWSTNQYFDVIVLGGSTPILNERLQAQLKPGGRLFAVVGEAPVMQAKLIQCSLPGVYSEKVLFETVIPKLVNAPAPARFKF
jgi:protein-L-isoaspartate(D-aspartate) O-methyltransferase